MKSVFFCIKVGVLLSLSFFTANAQNIEPGNVSGGWILERVELKEYFFDSEELASTVSLNAREAELSFNSPMRNSIITLMLLANDSVKVETIDRLVASGPCNYVNEYQTISIDVPVVPNDPNLERYVGQFLVIQTSPELVVENTYYYHNAQEANMKGVLTLHFKKEADAEKLKGMFAPHTEK